MASLRRPSGLLARALVLLAPTVLALALARTAAAIPFDEARHLVSRTGFGVTEREITALKPLGYRAAVRRLIRSTRMQARTLPPAWAHEPFHAPRFRMMSPEERTRFRKARRQRAIALRTWWYREMVTTPSPLTERMTLFWHNHFTSSDRKVRFPLLMYRQNVLLRRHALGNFRTLLHAIARDPAMVIYLDNRTNRAGKPNENFARELLELFTLGEGHYTERDIRAAARAFTGWGFERRTGGFRYRPRWHDHGEKTFMGVTGELGGYEVIEIVLKNPRVAEHITEKLWRAFVNDRPDKAEIKRLAAIFRAADYEIAPLLEALLTSRAFRAKANRGVLIKSPVDLTVGTMRTFGLAPPKGRRIVAIGRRLGQDVFNPPNVKGWRGGTAWITADTLLLRKAVLRRVLRSPAMRGGAAMPPAGGRRMDRKRMDRQRRNMGERMGEKGRYDGIDGWFVALSPALQTRKGVTALLLPIAPVNPPPRRAGPVRAVRMLVLDPAYQLK